MVQRVPAHLGETTPESVPPWVMIAGVALLLIVACAVIFFLLGGTTRLGLGTVGAQATPTRTRTPSPGITVIPVTLPPPTPTPTVAIVKYKVKAGDNLTSIAERYHVSIRAIMQANGLKDDNIRIGEELIIPLPTPTPLPGSSPPSPGGTPTPLSLQSPPTSADAAASPGVIRHIVRTGDTLTSIAATYGSTVDAIRAANQLASDNLSPGQTLVVPLAGTTPSSTVSANTTTTSGTQFTYAAPNLLAPSDAKQFRGRDQAPQLMWTSPATLKSNEFYVVHVEYILNGEKKTPPSLTVRQGTSVKLDPAVYYPGANSKGTPFSWYVVIVSQISEAKSPSAKPQTLAQSPPSETRTFVWY